MALALTIALAGCGGSGDGDQASAGTDPEGTVIDGPDPTATAVATPTSELTAAPTPEPTPPPTATPVPGPEAEIIEAWERYLRLSIEARGKDPSPEALDFDSYVAGLALDPVVQTIADGQAAGTYVEGSIESSLPELRQREDGAWIVEDCARIEARQRLRSDDRVVETELRSASLRGRIEQREALFVVEGFEIGEACAG